MKIRYLISHGVADAVDFDPSGSDMLSLLFEPRYNGALTLGSSVYTVTGGEVSLPLRALPDREYHPRLECEGGVFTVGGFRKSGRTVGMINDGNMTARLLKRVFELEAQSRRHEEAIARLDEACRGHDIFNFERK